MASNPRSHVLCGSRWQFASAFALSTFAPLGFLLTVGSVAAQQPSWTSLVSFNSPPARHGHGLVYHSQTRETVLFGGRDHQAPSGLLADTWVWDGGEWTEKIVTPSPGAREGHTMCPFGPGFVNSVLVFGGQDLAGLRNDLWQWSGAAWQQVASGGTWPTARTDAQLAYDPVRNVAVLFGGSDSGSAVPAATWEWNGATWSSFAPQAGGPAPRWGHRMGWDSVGNVILLFGGADSPSSSFTDTWAWDGSSWANLATTGPAGSLRGGMATDLSRGRVVYFGGNDINQNLNETWEWNGATLSWSQIATSFAPAARSNYGMVYDADRRSSLAFGGEVGLSDELWEYGFPALTVPYGAPCASGVLPSLSATPPQLGGTLNVSAKDFLPNVPGFLSLGFSDTAYGTTPLPLPLGSLGVAPNCNVYASPDVLVAIPVDARGGFDSGPLALPSTLSSLGDTYYFQAYALDLGPNGLAFGATNALKVVLGERHSQGRWEVLPNSPVAPYYHHDDIFFIDEEIGWVCNISGEIWKTSDGGGSWTRVWNDPSVSFRTLTFRDEMNGWVGNLGIGGWSGTVSNPNVLFSTTDGGLTWAPVTNISGPMPDGICGLQAIGPNTIHGAGRYDGDAYFISSTDGGASWVSQNLTSTYDAFVDVHFFTPDEGYITASNGNGDAALLYTNDGGASWTTHMTNNSYHYWKMGFASSTFGYAVCWGGPAADMWVQTYDGGQTWTDQHFANGFEANGIGFLSEQVGWIGGHENYTYQTTDGGNSWQILQIDPVYGDYINKFLKVSNRVVYAVGNRVFKWSEDHEHGVDIPASGFDNSLCTLSVETTDGVTTINYTVPEAGNAQITIYKRGGLIEARPIDGLHHAGTHTHTTQIPGNMPLYASIVTGLYRQRVRVINH